MDEPVVRLHGLCRYFAGVRAVDGVSLEVAPGERRAILGPNGAGKTTLFDLITGAQPATAGTVELFGRDVTRTPVWIRTRLGLARTFQTSRLLGGLTVEDNVYLAVLGARGGRLRVYRSGGDRELRATAREAIERVGLAVRLQTPARELSHGEQRQLEIATAIACRPRLMLLDEPAAGLSRSERQLLTQLLLSFDRDLTLVIIEHDMDVALSVAERVTIMHNGTVLTEDTPDRIRADQRVHDIYLGRAYGT
jgi:branched-chain amino acid transport system ATP-binding protein